MASEQAYPPHVQDDPTAQKIACGAHESEKSENQAQEKVERKTAHSTVSATQELTQPIGCCGGKPWYMDYCEDAG
jgi:hypothetical protein